MVDKKASRLLHSTDCILTVTTYLGVDRILYAMVPHLFRNTPIEDICWYIDSNLLGPKFGFNCVKSDSHLILMSVSLCVQISSFFSP